MNQIQTTLEQLKKHLCDVLNDGEALSKLTLSELDEALKLKHTLYQPTWEDRQAESKAIKERYMEAMIDEIDKLKAILHWGAPKTWSSMVNINDYKRQIIDYVNGCDVQEGSRSVPEYDMVWEMIKDGLLTLDAGDVWELDTRFVKYVMKMRFYRNPHRIIHQRSKKRVKNDAQEDDTSSDDEEDYAIVKTRMTPAERFWVNVLLAKRDNDNEFGALICLGLDTDRRAWYVPEKVTILGEDGEDLLPLIAHHYKSASISPLIGSRRGLGIILNNAPSQYYEYCDNTAFFANMISIEMPYMCYVYVKRVEIDVVSRGESEETKGRDVYVTVGTELILDKCKPMPDKYRQDNGFDEQLHTIKVDCKEKDTPGYYVSVSFGLFGSYETIRAVRIYGKAVSLVHA